MSPLTVIELVDPEAVWPPLDELVESWAVTVYEVIGLPPSAGAVKLTEADLSPAVAVPITGASGTDASVSTNP